MKKQNRRIVVDEHTMVSSVWLVPDGFGRGQTDAVILAHGAGHGMDHPFLSYIHESLARFGLLAVKFNFAYKEQGKTAPDSPAKLERTFREVVFQVRDDTLLKPGRIFIGGKSLGGRIASHLAAQGEEVAGLVFLGYPLHPPGQPAKLRVAHFRDVRCPMLFISGSRDPFCDLSLLRRNLKPLKDQATVHMITGGDHSFKVPKQTGRTVRDVWDEIARVAGEWLVNG